MAIAPYQIQYAKYAKLQHPLCKICKTPTPLYMQNTQNCVYYFVYFAYSILRIQVG